MAFVCLWIAFNAAYAQDLGDGANGATSERQAFRNVMADVCTLDEGNALAALVWQVFPDPIRLLLDNQYVFQPFWDALNNPRSDGSIPDHPSSTLATRFAATSTCLGHMNQPLASARQVVF